jgi:hypothetical protein
MDVSGSMLSLTYLTGRGEVLGNFKEPRGFWMRSCQVWNLSDPNALQYISAKLLDHSTASKSDTLMKFRWLSTATSQTVVQFFTGGTVGSLKFHAVNFGSEAEYVQLLFH